MQDMMNPVPSSWDQAIPQLSPDLDPSTHALMHEDGDADSYPGELGLPEQMHSVGNYQELTTMGRLGLFSHFDFKNSPSDDIQPCIYDGHVDSANGQYRYAGPEGHEPWNPYNTTAHQDTDFKLSSPLLSHLAKTNSVADGEVIADDFSPLTPYQLNLLDDEYRQAFLQGYPADATSLPNARKAWPSNVADVQAPSTAQAPVSLPITPVSSDTIDPKQELGEYVSAAFPSASSAPLPAKYSQPAFQPLCDTEPGKQRPLEQSVPFEDSRADIDIFYSDLSSDNVSQDANQYIDWCDTSPQDSPPLLLQTLSLPPVGDIPEDVAGSLSSSSDRPPEPAVNEPLLKEGSHKPAPVRTAPAVRKRRARNTTAPSKPAKNMAIQIVQEDGLGGSISATSNVPTVARARRNGPLSLDGRRDAALRRKDKTVCVWCRLAKKKCSGESPCTTCIAEQAKTLNFQQPCVKADFFQIVESGTCNYISQRAINHSTLDGSTRVRLELPETFEMKELLALVDARRGKFNIRARQAWGDLYVLDLNEIYTYLKEFNKGADSTRYDLREFIDSRVLKFNKWIKCVKDCDPTSNVFTLLSQWNNMPSRASYDFVPISPDATARPMDVQNPSDQTDILLAAQLSRIFCRKLEVDGFRALQNALNKNKWDDVPHDAFLKFVSQLGQILLTLRWRVSWWELLGDGGSKPDVNKERYEDRVRRLCQVLYFYYTSVKLKLPSWIDPTGLDGVWNTYADASSIWDDFPCVQSIDGFNEWMARGKELIKLAGVQARISKF